MSDTKQGRQEILTSLVIPFNDSVPLLQSVECTFGWVPLSVRFPAPFPKVLRFGPKRILTLLCLGNLRKDPPVPGDMHLTVRGSARQNQKDGPPPPTLIVGAWLISYSK